jgi:hypothetical protein
MSFGVSCGAFRGSFPPWLTLHVENEPSRRIIASKRKKVQFRTGFLRFPLAVLTRVWYHDGHAAFAAL